MSIPSSSASPEWHDAIEDRSQATYHPATPKPTFSWGVALLIPKTSAGAPAPRCVSGIDGAACTGHPSQFELCGPLSNSVHFHALSYTCRLQCLSQSYSAVVQNNAQRPPPRERIPSRVRGASGTADPWPQAPNPAFSSEYSVQHCPRKQSPLSLTQGV